MSRTRISRPLLSAAILAERQARWRALLRWELDAVTVDGVVNVAVFK
jgi:hypothetical protein